MMNTANIIQNTETATLPPAKPYPAGGPGKVEGNLIPSSLPYDINPLSPEGAKQSGGRCQHTFSGNEIAYPLDTLQQLSIKDQLALSSGLRKRSIKRFLIRKKILQMVDIHSPLEAAYWTTYYCNSELLQEGQKITAHYCGKRWCPICCSIKIAKLINGYRPVVEKFDQAAYMVLTVPNVLAGNLRSKLQEIQQVFRKMVCNLKATHGIRIKMIRTIECTYNIKSDNYHPHVNVIIDGTKYAGIIIDEWLKYFPDANRAAQYIALANEKSLNELFKYVAKIDDKTPPRALDIIYQALYRMRICQGNGVKKVIEDIPEIQSETYNVKPYHARWFWDQDKRDWFQASYRANRCKIGLCDLIDKGWFNTS